MTRTIFIVFAQLGFSHNTTEQFRHTAFFCCGGEMFISANPSRDACSDGYFCILLCRAPKGEKFGKKIHSTPTENHSARRTG